MTGERKEAESPGKVPERPKKSRKSPRKKSFFVQVKKRASAATVDAVDNLDGAIA
jgi:hypothetical protein